MKNRIKEIRKEKAKESQVDFGKKIGVQQAAVNKYETGLTKPNESVIELICIKYDVNKKWLETGEGPRDKEMTERELKIKQLEKVLDNKSDSLLHSLICVVDMDSDELRILLDNGLKIHEFYMEKEFKKRVNEKNVTK